MSGPSDPSAEPGDGPGTGVPPAAGPAEELPALPAAVRARVAALAADALGSMTPDEVPGPLRVLLRLRPQARPRRVTELAVALEADAGFRRRVVAHLPVGPASLVPLLREGRAPAAADPVEVAAVALLVRGPRWEHLAAVAAAQARLSGRPEDGDAAGAPAPHGRQQPRGRTGRGLRDRASGEGGTPDAGAGGLGPEEEAALRAELAAAHRDLRRRAGEVRALRGEVRAAQQAGQGAERAAREEAVQASEDLRRLRARLERTESELAALRREAREGREVADMRARLLLDTLVGAARGLERELALPPATRSPADAVPGAQAPAGAVDVGGGLAADDPGRLERLLALPRPHLLVDGYNVTLSAFAGLPLADQRSRLVAALARLAGRTAAEVTAVFDGADLAGPVRMPGVPGVRVLFSDPGTTADEVLLRLVDAEPAGRVVVVVSTDAAVAAGARARGAHSAPSAALARVLR